MEHETIYTPEVIGCLELGWGPGWLSPGGSEDVRELISETDVAGKFILDIGVGTGGPTRVLVQEFGAGQVMGIDIEQSVLDRAQTLNRVENLEDRISLQRVVPGKLPFPDAHFDIVFSKDSFVHVADKVTLFSEIHRVLKPGGCCLFSDWCCGSPPYSEEMEGFLANGMNFSMATIEETRRHLGEAGFLDITVKDRNAWFVDYAIRELEAARGAKRARFVREVGRETADRLAAAATRRATIAKQGHLRPTHLRATKPA
ncbi:class I SAM-dependent methyltransferase [Pelagibius sp. Alg239-R121]|uniref:class I SAM-dependent methyltransferase n=1 Tax=Pelagibius sp. Alg239-R121 TaxID=2993448 RepID=UPI0024A620F8|nr:class I SAM-dependent methyltransferase [Pelagibius sp. Alg239-R121]